MKARAVSILVICTLLLGGCFSKSDLKKPIRDYLSKEYGLSGDFIILSTTNNWFEGISHQTYVEIKKPYEAVIYLDIERDTYKIDESSSDDVLLQLFKGAFIKQYPEVPQKAKDLMKKYSLMHEPIYEEEKDPYYYMQLNMSAGDRSLLLEQFQKEKALDTKKIFPTLEPGDVRLNSSYAGVMNFVYDFNVYKHEGEVPQAASIAKDFADSRVLPEGFYNVVVNMVEVSPSSVGFGIDERSTYSLFHIDRSGKVKILQEGKVDDLFAGI